MRARYTLADAIRDHRTRHWSATPECRRNGRFGVVVDLEIAVLTKAVDAPAATHRARVHGWRHEEGEPSSPSGPRRRAHLSRPQVAACTFAFSPPGACRPAGFAASGAHNNGRRCVRTNAAKPNTRTEQHECCSLSAYSASRMRSTTSEQDQGPARGIRQKLTTRPVFTRREQCARTIAVARCRVWASDPRRSRGIPCFSAASIMDTAPGSTERARNGFLGGATLETTCTI